MPFGLSIPGFDALSLEKFTEQIKQTNLEGQKKWLADRVVRDLSNRGDQVRREDGVRVAEKLQRQLQTKVDRGTATESTMERLELVSRYRDFLEAPGMRQDPTLRTQAPTDGRPVDGKPTQSVDPKVPVEAAHAAHEVSPENDPKMAGEQKGRLRLFENDVYIEKRAKDPELLGASRNFVARGEGKQEAGAKGGELQNPKAAPPPAESASEAGGGVASEGATNAHERMSAAAKEKAATTLREKAAATAAPTEKQTMGEQGRDKPRLGEEPREKPALGQPKNDKFIASEAAERVQKGDGKQKVTENAPALKQEALDKLAAAREKLSRHVDGIERLPAEEVRKLRAEIGQLDREIRKLDRKHDPKSVNKGDRLDTAADGLRDNELQLAKQLTERQRRLESLVGKQAASGKGAEKTPEIKELEKEIGQIERNLWKTREQIDPKAVRKRDRLVTAGDGLRNSEQALANQIAERQKRLETLVAKQPAGKAGEKTPEIKGLEKEIGQIERRRAGLEKRIAENESKIAAVESAFVNSASHVGAARGAGKVGGSRAAALLGGPMDGQLPARPDGVRSFRAVKNDSVSRVARDRLEEQGLLKGLDDDAQDALIDRASDLIFRRNDAVLGAHPDHVMRGQELELPDFVREFGKSVNKQATEGVFSHIRA